MVQHSEHKKMEELKRTRESIAKEESPLLEEEVRSVNDYLAIKGEDRNAGHWSGDGGWRR
jgi:hypothetical protein